MKTINVKSRSGGYAVVCGRDSLRHLDRALRRLRGDGSVFVLSSRNVWKHWGAAILRKSRALSRDRVVLFVDRESAKSLATVETICRKLSRLRVDRHALLLAVGGGVVGDVAGFAAATYLRGVPVVHVPTTLAAQVDSAIGGKTGVNLPEGKNLVGAFYSPQIVIADPSLLRTLPARQFRSGIYEVIKYGVIGGAALFSFLERKLDDVLRMDIRALEFIVERSVEQKARVVSKDERESGLRQVLNFGHTIGHALETLTRYEYFLHGEAVAWGMLGAVQIAVSLGHLTERDSSRIARLIARCGNLPRLPAIPPDTLLRALAGDKKSRGGRIGWVLPRKVGAVQFGVNVPAAHIVAAWHALPAFYNRVKAGI